MREHTAPSFVQTQVEGRASLFQVPYYGGAAYLTQTSQLYLETQLPVLGDCYTIQSSFRAERAFTRRHLSEYTHVEGELDFITFDDLLDHIEDLLCGVINILLANEEIASYFKSLKPDFKAPSRPFRRMRYTEALEWLNEHGTKTDEGKDHVFGDEIAEVTERAMTNSIGVPIMLNHFPSPSKAFYM
jgi:asparaginyl-tRNA synthetase